MSDWTEDDQEELKKLVDEGLSSTEIGKKIGRTRNAVIGRAQRTGLTLKLSKVQRAPKAPRVKGPRFNFRKVVNNPKPPQLAIVNDRVKPGVKFNCSIIKLENNNCRWPLWDDVETPTLQFCGDPSADVADRRPYCAYHSRIARGADRRAEAVA